MVESATLKKLVSVDLFPIFHQRNKLENIFLLSKITMFFPYFFISQISKRNKLLGMTQPVIEKGASHPFSMTGWVMP